MQRGARLGPYEIVAQIGAGGMGEVYQARDTRLGRDVAIKVLPEQFASDPERLLRFEQEARAAGQLNHPNILAVYDLGTHGGAPYIVTELLEGESLRDRAVPGPLPVRKAVEIGIQIAQGLAAAHGKGIIHRDLKPGNIFLTRDGHVKIIDFGIAKLVAPAGTEERANAPTTPAATAQGTTVGTVGYMSPEQVRGQALDARSDIFSLGCVIYEMLSGRPPFKRETAPDTTSAILHEDPAALGRGTPPALNSIVGRCLEKRPDDRFSSARDLALALEAVGSDTLEVRAAPRDRARWLRSLRWVAPGVVLLGALALGGAWVLRHVGWDSVPGFHPQRVPVPVGVVSELALSPSGGEIAYTAEEREAADIWVTDVRGGNPIRLTDGSTRTSSPTWFPDGSAIAFSSAAGAGGSVWKVPRFGGTAMLLVSNAQYPAISPDGQQIAFARPQKDGALRIWAAPIAAPESARQLTTDREGLWDHRRPAWSPDGRTICYEDARDLWLVPTEGGTARPFTTDKAWAHQATWSADGRYIYFVSDLGGTRWLWRKPVTGGEAVRLTQGVGAEESPSRSRDGHRMALLSGLETWFVSLVNLRTGKVTQLGHARHTAYPGIAPDGQSIVYATDQVGSWDLWSQPLRDNAPVGDPTRLTDQPGECVVPTFSPDGRWIAYFRVVDGKRDIYVIPARGGVPVDFTNHPSVNVEPAWSPDGREIAFVSNRSGWHQVWAAPFANGHRTGEPRRISSEEGDATYPTWSPDGKRIAYILGTEGGREVRVVPSTGGGVSRTLTSGADARLVRWWWARNLLVVSGFWGERTPSIRLLPPDGGEASRLVLPDEALLDLKYPLFELSSDGTLIALFGHDKQEEIWLLEADKGLF